MSGRHRQTPVRGRPARGRHRRPTRRAQLMLPAVAAVGVLGVGGVSAAAVFVGGSDARPASRPRAEATPVVHLPAPGATASTPMLTASPPLAPSPSPAAPHRGRAVDARLLSLTAVGRVSWVEVDGPNGRVLYLGMLRHGHTISFAARPLVITLGNAGAVRIVHGRQVYRRAGAEGQVRRFHVTT